MKNQALGYIAALAIGGAAGATINGAKAGPENKIYEGPADKKTFECVQRCMAKLPVSLDSALGLAIYPSPEKTGFSYRVDK